MKKKSYTARLGALALALTMVTTCLTGGTMAKYVTTVSATGSATVAKFDVDIKGNDTSFLTNTQDIEFFSTHWYPPVNDGVKESKLAPGVYGYFDIVVTNKSDVLVKVSDVDIRATNEKGIRMKYAVLTDPVNENKPDNFNVEETNLKDEIKSARMEV